MEEGEHSIKDLAERIDLLREEVDALQTAALNQHAPWYKNVPTVISIMALLFSFGTTYVSFNRIKGQDIQAQRSELRTMLQRLASLPKENFELERKYEGKPASAAFLSGYISQENALLARQASEIVRKLPRDRVSASEYYAVALALQNSYNYEGAMIFFQHAIQNSDDFNSELAALKTYAHFLFICGQREAGRDQYRKALNIFSRYNGYNDFIQKSNHIWTELAWAISEALTGSVNIAHQHVEDAEKLLSSLPSSPSPEQLKKQIAETKASLSFGTPLAMPYSGPP